MTTRLKLHGIGTALILAAGLVLAQSHPSHQITNGEITATVYLPDAKNGFYKTARSRCGEAAGSALDDARSFDRSDTLMWSTEIYDNILKQRGNSTCPRA